MRYRNQELNRDDVRMLQDDYGFIGFVVSDDFFYLVKNVGVCRIDIFKDGRAFASCDPGKYGVSDKELNKDKKKLSKFMLKLISDSLLLEYEEAYSKLS